ncbi:MULTISPECIES: OmpA family protein [unclassified Pseudoalteromonas]|uniref:OmpA family protein n=2 Tax=Gammaproteobacteria TaxID=1236 RepID=UPI000425B650|nr:MULTISPECIES: OmpA family protein [unclassified Pseudoalteromonas]MBH0060828.1 OmpA family protein [Pseudoalteromonas sp. NZS71]PKH91003.1 OmpA family protein [Pseudoalteromonas sp. 78C3]
MHDISKGSASPLVYLLTGYVKHNKPIGKLTPVANRIVIAEQPKSATYNTKKPIVLKTNKAGILSTINSDSLEVRQPFHAYMANNQRPIIIPPMESIGLIANNNPRGWAKEFVDNLKNYSSSNTPLLELQTIPITNLKQPTENSEDDTYNKWYEREIIQKNVKSIQAYVLAKTRAVVLSINPNIPLLSPGENIVLSSPIGRDIPATFVTETNLAVITGTNKILPKGLYRVKIRLQRNTYEANIASWCTKSIKFDGTHYYYELAEMIHFDIKNEAGEFDVINCDPLSVEEAIIKQFPRFYSHLISYAKDLKTEHATYDPKNISIKDENGKEVGRAKVSDEPIKIASGFESFCHGWAVAKGRAQLAAGLINTDITASASNGNFTTNGKFVLGSKIAKAIHTHLNETEDKTIQATLDSVFAMQDGQDAWKKLREARAAFTTDAWRQALAENLWRLPANTPAAMESYNKSLGKKLGIPKVAMDAAGNALNIADLTTNIAALGQTTLQQFGTNIPNLAQAKRHYKTVANDYFEHLSAKEIVKDVVIEGTFSLNSEQVTDDYRNTILQQSEAVIKALKQNENLKVTVAGHTCDIGNYDYNIALSERRAEAVKHILVTQAGIDEARIEVLGLGYAQPLINNKDEASRAQNRRVHIAAYAISQINVCPSREGMDSLERFRNLTVANDIKVDETGDDMAWQMINIALGVMAFIPITAPIAAAVAVIKAGGAIATSAANLMDEALLDNACKQFYAEIQRDKRLGQECAANQGMMHELLSEYNKDGKTQQSTQWAAQFRLRSEAISGLMGLLLRAQREGDKSQYYSNLERYKVKQYIENFLLGDSWALPNLPGASIRMDTFWVFLIDSITNQKQSKNGDKKALYGFSDNYSLLDKATRKAVVTDPENTLYLQSQSNPYGFYMMTVPTVAREHNYITAEFQNYFPIHTFATQEKEGNKYLESFANTFEPVFSDYGEASYHHSAIYYQDQTSKKWLPIIANKLKRLTPFTPIRVLVVFNDTMTGIAPITLKVTRCDGVNNELAYKELVRPLVESELLNNEKHFAGKFGCVFTPFFQLGPKTYLGTKPMVHEEAFYSIINDSAVEYYQDDNFSDMRYFIGAQVGSSREVVLPLMGERKDNSDEMIFESDTAEVLYALGIKNKFVANEFYVDLNTKRNGGNEESLLIKDFLTSSSSSFVYPELFAGEKSIRILVRFGGEGKPYLITSKIQRQGQFIRLFESEFAAAQSLGFKVRQFGDDIIFDDFDWNTQVDIMVVATCTELESDNYTKKLIGLDWRSVPCDLILQQTIGINDQGPKYKSKLCYLGKATRNANKGYKTERILNKMVDTWHDDDYQFEDKWYDNQCQIDEQVGPEYEELIELLNNAGPYNEKGKQARALLNWHNKDAEAFAGEEQVFVFAANFSLKYESPKRVEVNGLRPFGDIFTSQFSDMFTDKEDRQYTMELGIASFNSAGNSGFNFNDIGSMTDKISNHGLQLKLPLPNPTNSNLPWGKTLPEADLKELAAELNSDHSTPSQKDLYKRLSEEGLTEDEVKQWFVEDATKKKVRPLGAFKSE